MKTDREILDALQTRTIKLHHVTFDHRPEWDGFICEKGGQLCWPVETDVRVAVSAAMEISR